MVLKSKLKKYHIIFTMNFKLNVKLDVARCTLKEPTKPTIANINKV